VLWAYNLQCEPRHRLLACSAGITIHGLEMDFVNILLPEADVFALVPPMMFLSILR
jgi:hypothetical protein